MTTITTTIERPGAEFGVDSAELAAIAFLARYSGRTLDAYRHDLRNLFQWAADHDLAVLEATRAHLELYRTSMEERGLAASTIDRRLSTACVTTASLTSTAGSALTRPSMSAVPPCIPPSGEGWTEASWVSFSSPPNDSTTLMLRWLCCWD